MDGKKRGGEMEEGGDKKKRLTGVGEEEEGRGGAKIGKEEQGGGDKEEEEVADLSAPVTKKRLLDFDPADWDEEITISPETAANLDRKERLQDSWKKLRSWMDKIAEEDDALDILVDVNEVMCDSPADVQAVRSAFNRRPGWDVTLRYGMHVAEPQLTEMRAIAAQDPPIPLQLFIPGITSFDYDF